MARESTVAFKGIQPASEETGERGLNLAGELRELMVAAEPRVRNLFQQSQGFRLKFRDDPTTYIPGNARDVFFVDGESYSDNCHFSVDLSAGVVEVGMKSRALEAWEELLNRWGAGEEVPALLEARRERERLKKGS